MPDIVSLERLTRALAMLDAILSPEWEFRYYSFNAHWAPGAALASMRNGSGDLWVALFASSGVALHGLAHESPVFRPGQPPPGLFERLPPEFHDCFLHEPAFETSQSTFCIWRRADDTCWHAGGTPAAHEQDGSSYLLAILEGLPEQYVDFAREYYEVLIPLDAVAAVYRHAPLTTQLVHQLNPALDFVSLGPDIHEIGYPQAG